MTKVLDLFGKPTAKRRETGREEYMLQVAVIAWASLREGRYPELSLLHHIPNGGHRYKQVAAGLKRAGVKPGVPDLVLPVARGGYHGLYLELKSAKGRSTPLQHWWQEQLVEQGYSVAVARDLNTAVSILKNYLENKP